MNKRFDILSLNLRNIRRTLPSASQTKLIVLQENEDSQPFAQTVIKQWMLTLSNQIFISRNKVGNELLQHCRRGFILDDPYIRETRFYVEYHRLHDPALQKYYASMPVKNRLKKLHLVSQENDAKCTHKEFTDYIRYLDTNLNYNITQKELLEVQFKIQLIFNNIHVGSNNISER